MIEIIIGIVIGLIIAGIGVIWAIYDFGKKVRW